jgi:PRTRC genetic system ThiF family protein
MAGKKQMNIPQIPHPFDFHQQISEVVLVGLGGTGSQVARTLCRIVYDLRRRGHHTPSIKFVDPDLVEMKNVGRQMFTEADVGRNKAVTLARRFNLAMGLNIVAYPELFDGEKHVGRYGTLLVGCVDNHLARLELSKVRALWLDCGNDRASGQVCLGNTSRKEEVQRCIKSGQYTHLPNAALLFPQLLEPESEIKPVTIPAASCADLVEMGDQVLLVNDMIGIVAGEYIYKLLNRLPITTFLTYADTEALSMRSVPVMSEVLCRYLT